MNLVGNVAFHPKRKRASKKSCKRFIDKRLQLVLNPIDCRLILLLKQ